MTKARVIPVDEVPDVVSSGRCMGCGFCQLAVSEKSRAADVTMEWSQQQEFWTPVLNPVAETADSSRGTDVRICPGAIMDMPALAQAVYGRQPKNPMLGEALLIAAGHASDPEIRRRAASGGITTALLAHLLETRQIDMAYCTAGRNAANGGGMIARSSSDLWQFTGSHYHPVNFGKFLPELVGGKGRFAFVGLPCEIAAMRELMLMRPDLEARCIVMVGLFCGGINRFSSIAGYLKNFGVRSDDVSEIDYRDGVWPGHIKLLQRDGSTRRIPRIMGNSRWNILRYVIAFQGYGMLPRCRICPDQIADFADIAVGDPHLPRFKGEASDGHSAIVARTGKGHRLLTEAASAGAIALEPLTAEELIESQGYTLENRRHATVYARMWQLFGMQPPAIRVYDGLERARSRHQFVYAFVDLAKIRLRNVRWLHPLHMPMQIFEYLFLTFSPRLVLSRFRKLLSNR